MFWGFSEALDLHREFVEHIRLNENPTELNILLFGSCDPRHIIKSLAKSYTHNTKFNFFIIEACPALIARHILLTGIALEPPELLTLKSKVHLFIDVFGNSLLRSSSTGYVSSKANHLLKCITDLEYGQEMQSIFNVSQLKYVERDCLEILFNFWRDKRENYFDISAHWMHRLRQHLGERYDTRIGAFDWDLQMKLKEFGATQICAQEYKHWRESGVAFTFPEYKQSNPNKTLAIQVQSKNVNSNRRYDGYIGDIQIGPFATFGLACDDMAMLRSNHGQNEFRSTDITERNLFELFYEIENRKPFQSNEYNVHKLGASILDMGKSFDYSPTESSVIHLKQFNSKLLNTDDVTIIYLSGNDIQNIIDGKTFKNYFNIIFVGRNYFPLLKPELATVIAKNALILFETAQYSVQRKEEIGAFLKKIRNFAKEMNLTSVTNFHINVPLAIAKFRTN